MHTSDTNIDFVGNGSVADKLMHEFFSPEELSTINRSIKSLKAVFDRVEFDTDYLFSILETIRNELIKGGK